MHMLVIILFRACLWPQSFVLGFYLSRLCTMRLWVEGGYELVLVLLWDLCAECAVQITLFMLKSFYFKLQFSRCQLANECCSEKRRRKGYGSVEANVTNDALCACCASFRQKWSKFSTFALRYGCDAKANNNNNKSFKNNKSNSRP